MLSAENYEVLCLFRNNPIRLESGATDRIKSLVGFGYLSPISIKSETVSDAIQFYDVEWEITVSGLDALCEFEKDHEQHAKEERQQRFDNKVSIASVLMPLITFVLGLITEHHAGIIRIIVSLFQ